MLEKELLRLKEEGTNLAASLQCPFLDVSSRAMEDQKIQGGSNIDSQFVPQRMEEALRALIENIRLRSGLLKMTSASGNPTSANTQGGTNNTEPDIR